MPAAHALRRLAAALTLSLVAALPAAAAVIGSNTPATSLSAERIAALPAAERAAWQAYWQRSQQQRAVDQAALAADRASMEVIPPGPEGGHAEKSMPLNQSAAWYAGEAARRVADNILSFQTPAGGWGKNQPRDKPPRLKGQDFVTDNNSPRAIAGDFDLAANPRWSYVGTIDNDATITEIRFLAKVATQLGTEAGAPYRASALRGLQYLVAAQYPNGGWPQVWPLQGGYHDAITINDNAMAEVAELLGDAGRGEGDFAFVPAPLREQAAAAERRAIDLFVTMQLSAKGRKLIWAQQNDPLTLAPVSARNYEPPALCVSESADLLLYLMSLREPSPAVRAAVHTGIATLHELARSDLAWGKVNEADGRRLTQQPGAGPLWARYYDLSTHQPIFGDRDKSLHDDVNEVSLERRNGYAWWGIWPRKTLTAYEAWAKRWPAAR